MAINAEDYVLVDKQSGILLGADTTVVVPEVYGEVGYEIAYDEDAAIEYGEAQGHPILEPGAAGVPVDELGDEPRGYLAIDTDTGFVCNAEDLRLVPYSGEELSSEEALELASSAPAPVASKDVLNAEGLPFESVGG